MITFTVKLRTENTCAGNRSEYTKIKNKYNQIIGSYQGTDCENQKVSVEMIEALKAIRDAND